MKRILFCFLLLTGICLSGSTGQDQSAGYAAIDFRRKRRRLRDRQQIRVAYEYDPDVLKYGLRKDTALP